MTTIELNKLKQDLKVELKGYKKMTCKKIRRLEELGFTLVRIKKHCIFSYNINDKTLIFEFPKTPGDFRAGIKKTFDVISVLRQEVRD